MKKLLVGVATGALALSSLLVYMHSTPPSKAPSGVTTPASASMPPPKLQQADGVVPPIKARPATTATIPNDVPLPSSDTLDLPDSNPAFATFGDRFSEVSARRNGKLIDPQALYLASREKNAWQKIDKASEKLNLSEEDLVDGREFIHLNPLKLESLVKGDRLEIRVEQIDQTYTVLIDTVAANDDGRNVTWTGAIEELEGYHQVTITRGEDLIVGGITTPEGLFQLQGQGDEGWIVNSATLFKGVDQQVVVPDQLIANPPMEIVYLPAETFSANDKHAH
jgi:hypothetical protein